MTSKGKRKERAKPRLLRPQQPEWCRPAVTPCLPVPSSVASFVFLTLNQEGLVILLKFSSNLDQAVGFICSLVYTRCLSPIPEPGWVLSPGDRRRHDLARLLQTFCQLKEVAPCSRASIVRDWEDTASLCQVAPLKGRM